MKHYQSLLLLLSPLFAAVVTVNGVISEECRQETETLQQNSELDSALENVLTAYLEDYEDTCDFSGGVPECSLEFDADNATTYEGLCQSAGGQVYERRVNLNCGVSVATVDFNLGTVPNCIGSSCNATEFEPNEFNNTRIDQFVEDLKFTGCEGQLSDSAAGSRSRNIILGLLAGSMLSVASIHGWL